MMKTLRIKTLNISHMTVCFITLAMMIILSGCGGGSKSALINPNIPTITSFSPTSGPPGTVITLTGTNFIGITTIKFNGTAAAINSVTGLTDTSLNVTVPVGATTGKISATTSEGTATSTTDFVVSAPTSPVFISFTPTNGAIGTVVTINGTNLAGITAIKFNGTAVAINNITDITATSVKATVPAGTTTGKISLTTHHGTATSSTDFTVTTTPTPEPTITSFTPTSGAVGTIVTIAGTNLTGTTTVKFGNIVATTITDKTATSLKATVPTGATTGKISVTTPDGSVSSTINFTVTTTPIPSPTITSFTPTSGSVGTIVTITGTNLTGVTNVKFNNTSAITITDKTNTSLKVIIPINSTTGKISVTTHGGTVSSLIDLTISTIPKDGAEMIWVPGNSFTMGTEFGPWYDVARTQQVTLSGYWIYKYEVTVAQYRIFCTETGHALPPFPQPITDLGWSSNLSWSGKSGWDDLTLQQHPIVNVSWNDCYEYTIWAGVSMPTEAQWEYAAGGLQQNNYPWGGVATKFGSDNGWDESKCANRANSYNLNISTWSVGHFTTDKSWCGAMDMAGNVSEWCLDKYENGYSSTHVINPSGSTTGEFYVARGKSWNDSLANIFRNTYRNCRVPTNKEFNYGFRCVSNTP